jgi:hypothetical protein
MSSLVEKKPLGSKENPHIYNKRSNKKSDRIKFAGQYCLYKGELRTITNNGSIRKLTKELYKFKTLITNPGVRMDYNACLKRLKDCECELLYNEEEFNKNYKNVKSIIKVKYYCGCQKEEKWINIHMKLKRVYTPITGENSTGLKCGDCNSMKNQAIELHLKNYNEETNEYKCSCCGIYKNYDTCFRTRTNGGGNGKANVCNDCYHKKEKEKHLKWTDDEFIDNVVKACYYNERLRIKKGRIFQEKGNITREFVKELRKEVNNKARFTGKNMITAHGDIAGNCQLSIDRIDSNKSYTKDNIQLVCTPVNNAKCNMSDDEFIKMCGEVWTYRRGKDGHIDSEIEKLKKEIEQLKERLNN